MRMCITHDHMLLKAIYYQDYLILYNKKPERVPVDVF